MRVLLSTYDSRGGVEPLVALAAALGTALTPETRARATAVAGTIRAHGVTVDATLLVEMVSGQRPPLSA